jgi:ABC-type lipoprotein release transport system permease subunit
MLFKLAWRNIWRNKRRSVIVLGSILVGIVALIFSDGLTTGMLRQMLFNQISSNISHIQIHKKGFNDNKVVKSYIDDAEKIESVLKNNPQVEHYSKRVITFGLLSSAYNSSGVYINGIDANKEQNITQIKNSIVEGTYLTGSDREIVIGKKLAEKLNVSIGDKIVAMATRTDGKIGSDAFRIVGLYTTFSSDFDRIFIYIDSDNIQNMLNLNDNVHEFAIITTNQKKVTEIKTNLINELGDEFEILTYEDLLPLLVVTIDMYKESMIVLDLIIGLALIFGIINVMLMSVFERINEFGVLMSIGMKNSKLFLMIVFEAFIIGVIGTIAGLIIGLLIHYPISITGIDFSVFAEGLDSYGVGAIIYPYLSIENIITMIIIIPFIVVLGAIYPAFRAIRLQPVYAVRYV